VGLGVHHGRIVVVVEVENRERAEAHRGVGAGVPGQHADVDVVVPVQVVQALELFGHHGGPADRTRQRGGPENGDEPLRWGAREQLLLALRL
jgi:hypothetical protein